MLTGGSAILGAVRASISGIRVAIALVVVGTVAAVGAAWAGVVLADIYRPHAPDADLADLPPNLRRSASWSDWHLRATVVFLATTIGASAVVVWLMYRAERLIVRRAVVLVCSVAAVTAALVTLLTRGLVEWDQLALRRVIVGSNISGYWFAAFDDDIRYVLVGNSEVSQSQYVPALLAHLGAPMAGAAALMIVALTLLRSYRTALNDR